MIRFKLQNLLKLRYRFFVLHVIVELYAFVVEFSEQFFLRSFFCRARLLSYFGLLGRRWGLDWFSFRFDENRNAMSAISALYLEWVNKCIVQAKIKRL